MSSWRVVGWAVVGWAVVVVGMLIYDESAERRRQAEYNRRRKQVDPEKIEVISVRIGDSSWTSIDTVHPRYIQFRVAPAPADSLDTIYAKVVGLDTLQYALSLLEGWSDAFDSREYAGKLKAKTDSLLNDPVIRERRVIR